MSLFSEDRIVRYNACSVIAVLWVIKKRVTTTLNAAHSVPCSDTISQHNTSHSDTTSQHNTSHSDTIFTTKYNLNSFVAVETRISPSQTLTVSHLLLPHFCGLGDLPNGSSVPPLAVLSHQPLMCSADRHHLHHGCADSSDISELSALFSDILYSLTAQTTGEHVSAIPSESK